MFKMKLVTLSEFLVMFLKVAKFLAIAVKFALGNPQN